MSDNLTIVIPTFRRPEGLRRLLHSVIADIGDREDVSILVVDNDAAESAKATVEAMTAPCPITYIVEKAPGVSNARNTGIAQVTSRWLLFLDDDMEIATPFIDPMIATATAFGASATFGPVTAVLPEEAAAQREWLAPLFDRERSEPSGLIDEAYGTGGCLIDLSRFDLPTPPFDPALNETGGEDDEFFAAIRRQGGLFAWCADAIAREHVPAHRVSARYLWRRHFAYGQTPSRSAADGGLRGMPKVLGWMAVGAAQFIAHAAAYGAKLLLRSPTRIEHYGRMAQGLGKILWWDSLSPRFYGAAAR